MDLLEYQAKEWFRETGIPVLPSQRIDHPTDIKKLRIPYPVVLKSQVHRGGRGRAGGIKFVATTIDAIASAQMIFNLPIDGELPEVLLAESKYDAEQELYLAVALDAALRRPILIGSPKGGMDVETTAEQMQSVIVAQEFSPFYARKLAVKMGLHGQLIQTVGSIVEKMYDLFIRKDLDFVEINPLAVNASGEVMALDGKVTVNDRAIARHTDVALIAAKMASRQPQRETKGDLEDWDGVELNGKIGIIGNGAGLVMTTLDLVTNAGGKPATCINVGHGNAPDPATTNFGDRLAHSLEILTQDKTIQVILINLLGYIPQAFEITEILANFCQRHKRSSSKSRANSIFPRLVIRLWGTEVKLAKKRFADLGVSNNALIIVENLDEAVTQAVSLAKPSSKK